MSDDDYKTAQQRTGRLPGAQLPNAGDPPTNPVRPDVPAEVRRQFEQHSNADDPTDHVALPDELTELSSTSDAHSTNPYQSAMQRADPGSFPDRPENLNQISESELSEASDAAEETIFPRHLPPSVRAQKSFPTPIPGYLEPPPHAISGRVLAVEAQRSSIGPPSTRSDLQPHATRSDLRNAEWERSSAQPRVAESSPPWREPEPEPEPKPPRRPLTAAFEMTARQRKVLTLATPVVVAVATGWLVMAAAVRTWTAPQQMFLWILAGAIPTTLVMTLIVALLKDRRPRFADVKPALFPLTASCALLLIVGGAWQLGLVRGMLRSWAPTDPAFSERVMQDRSLELAVEECGTLAGHLDEGAHHKVLLDGLIERPELVTPCLALMDEEAKQKVGANLIDRWRTDLFAPHMNARDGCAIASAMTGLPRGRGEIQARLLECIVEATDPTVRECCAQQIPQPGGGKIEWVAGIQPTDDYVPAESTALALMSLAFEGTGPDDSQFRLAREQRFAGPEAQRMAVAFACVSLRESATAVASHLRASLHGRCDVEVSRLPDDVASWKRVCDASEARLLRRRQDPGEALCEAAKQVLGDGRP